MLFVNDMKRRMEILHADGLVYLSHAGQPRSGLGRCRRPAAPPADVSPSPRSLRYAPPGG